MRHMTSIQTPDNLDQVPSVSSIHASLENEHLFNSRYVTMDCDNFVLWGYTIEQKYVDDTLYVQKTPSRYLLLILAMGQHDRLGANCWFRQLTMDILELIWGLCTFNLSSAALYTPQHQPFHGSELGMFNVFHAPDIDMITTVPSDYETPALGSMNVPQAPEHIPASANFASNWNHDIEGYIITFC